MRTGRADVVGAVADHDCVARVGAREVERGANEVRLVAAALRPIGTVNGVEESIETEVTDHEPRRSDRADSDDLKRMARVAK